MSDSEPEDAVTDDAPPLLAGRYRLQGMLGAGGMGTVYRARDLELDEVVALKILQQIDAETLARFRDEVRLARRVTHRNVARTFDIGDADGARFLTMEYVDGETLSRLLARGRIAPARAFELAMQIAAGLAAIHAEGLAHGDLKPGNVLVDGAGTPKLGDFGLARVAEPRQTGVSPGTPEYMAPEQLSGSLADAQSDVFALGTLLCELFGGARPWTGTRTEVLGKKLLGTAPDLPTALPAGLRSIVARCLAFDRAARFQDAGELVEALAHQTAPARAPSSGPHAPLTRPERGATRVAVRALRADVPADGYLGLALASDIARLLATAPELEVLGAPLPSGDDTPERAGRLVSADAVIEGSVRRSGTSLRFALRLVSVDDGFLVWGRSVTTLLTDAVGELESASRAIAAALSAKPAVRRGVLGLRDPKLLDLYLRARHDDGDIWHDVDADNSAAYADLLEAAPNEPLLLASYAASLTRAAFRIPDALDRARRAAESAVRLAPELAEASFSLGLVLFLANDTEGAARAMVRALELSPSMPGAHSVLGQVLVEIGRADEGLVRLELARRLDPRLTIAWANAARMAAYDASPERCDALLAGAPSGRSLANEWLYWLTRARIALYRGDDAARGVVRELSTTPFAHVPMLRAMARALAREATIEEARAAIGAFGGGGGARPLAMGRALLAEIAMFLGDPGVALQCIGEAEVLGIVDVDWLDRCPLFAPLRETAPFREARERVGARAARVNDALAAAGLSSG